MTKEKEILKELNVAFKKKGWKLLPEDNDYSPNSNVTTIIITKMDGIWILRSHIPYIKHIGDYTKYSLDKYVSEYLIKICKNYNIKVVNFFDMDEDFKISDHHEVELK